MQKKEELSIIEAMLVASPEPLTQQKVNLVFEADPPIIKEIVDQLNQRYISRGHAFYIEEIAGGYQIVTNSDYEVWVRRLLNKSGRLMLSNASMETVAIIAYKQPVSRVDIEAIRGVDSSGVIKTLLSKKLIKIKGRDSGPGRALLYMTTRKFLEHFGLSKLSEMPKLKEIKEISNASESGEIEQIQMFNKNNDPLFLEQEPPVKSEQEELTVKDIQSEDTVL